MIGSPEKRHFMILGFWDNFSGLNKGFQKNGILNFGILGQFWDNFGILGQLHNKY